MSIKIDSDFDSKEKIWNVALIGELDVSSANLFKETLNNLVDENLENIKIDLDKLEYIDSTGLGVMVGVLKRLKVNDKGIYLNNPKSNVRKILEITGLDKIFNVEG
ncbi:STAS domain-containing protein [Peptacetobacter sp.]|uniref:STAS domain-containing protein n=1 Tax=Peptacetobacter sp. TaxID=2991975 RepID=UPI002633CEA1|nr:STAS domain-containing protein [Peptacetobacter sp.]